MTTRPLRPSFSISATTAAQAASSAKVVDGDVGAGRGQAERDSAPYAAAGAGHQRNGSCQVKLDAHATSQ